MELDPNMKSLLLLNSIFIVACNSYPSNICQRNTGVRSAWKSFNVFINVSFKKIRPLQSLGLHYKHLCPQFIQSVLGIPAASNNKTRDFKSQMKSKLHDTAIFLNARILHFGGDALGKVRLQFKNPAYKRQSISRPMRIVAPIPRIPRIPKNPFFFFRKTEKIIQNAKTQKCLEICQN